jgi:hypothetical protein
MFKQTCAAPNERVGLSSPIEKLSKVRLDDERQARGKITAVGSFQIEVTFSTMGPIRTLFAASPTQSSKVVLPESLRARYDGDLSFPPASQERPYCIANFVSTLDGVVSFNMLGQSEGAQISKSNEEDRFHGGPVRPKRNKPKSTRSTEG